MTRSERHIKRKLNFWDFYLIYVGILLIVLAIVFFNIRSLMVKYEQSSPESYALSLVQNAEPTSKLGKYLEEKNFSDSRFSSGSNRKKKFYNAVDNANLEISPVAGNYDSLHPAFNITADGKPLISLRLNEIKSTAKLGGILNLSEWDLDYAITRISEGELELQEDNTINVTATIPEGFTLLIDGEKINADPSNETELEEFALASKVVKVPKGLSYTLENLCYEPELTALNNGSELLTLEKNSDGTYFAKPEFVASPEAKDFLLSVCNPLEIGKNWSKFMTADLEGDLHGFYTAINGCRLLYDTEPYNLAYRWATGIDVTFVSNHVLLGFTNEKVDNFVKYNDSLYSCDVYFEKNMQVSGQKTDVFNNRLFFGAAWGTWYLLDMVAL